MSSSESQFQNIQKWFIELDYSSLTKLDPMSMALQISSRKVFRDQIIFEALRYDEYDEYKTDYRNFEEYIIDISVSVDLYSDSPNLNALYMPQINFWRLLREGKTIEAQLEKGESLFPCFQHQQYWDERASMPVRPHSIGDELLFRRIWKATKSIAGYEKSVLKKVFPKMNILHGDPFGFREFRKANPLPTTLEELLPSALDAQIKSRVNQSFREGQHRFVVDLRYPDTVIENAFKAQLKSYREQYSIKKPKNMTKGLMAKIIYYKAIQYLDIDIMSTAFRYELTEIDKARIAFNDKDLDSNRFNQNIKPFMQRINDDVDISLMASQLSNADFV